MTMPATADRLMTTNEAAPMLGYAPRTLMRWRVERGGPPFVRIGGRVVRYRESDLVAWIAAQQTVDPEH